jgi:MFS family permease
MSASRLRANLWRYQAFQVLVTAFLFMPVIVLFWQENGLDPFDIYLLQGLFAVAVVLLEVPTGMIADRLGKRASLIAAAGLIAVGMVVYSVSSSFALFLSAEVVLAVGVALVSGADSALLYDTLHRLGRQNDFRRLEGNARGMQMASIALFTILGGFVGEISYRATIWLSGLGPLLALVVAIGFVEANPRSPGCAWHLPAARE